MLGGLTNKIVGGDLF